MAMTPEAKVKKQIKAILDARGAVYCMPVSGGYGKSGVSDFIVCYYGQFISIEAKAGKGKITALQGRWLGQVKSMGGCAVVIREDNLELLIAMLSEIRSDE